MGPPDVRSAALLSKPPERRFVFRWTFSLTLLNTEISFFNYFEKLNVGISDDAAYDGLKMGEKFFVDLSHVKNDSDRTFGVYEVTAVV